MKAAAMYAFAMLAVIACLPSGLVFAPLTAPLAPHSTQTMSSMKFEPPTRKFEAPSPSSSFAGMAVASLAVGAAAGLALRSKKLQVLARRTHAVKIYDTCIGCTLCCRACPTDVLEMVPANINPAKQVASAPRVEDCVGCKRCEAACPTDFLSIRVYLQENSETVYTLGLDLADWS